MKEGIFMIRTATIEDLEPLAKLYKAHKSLDREFCDDQPVFDDKICLEKMREYITESVSFVLCSETDKEIDGFAILMPLNPCSTKENPDGMLCVNELFVAENSRRKGIGTAFFREIYKIAEKTFCSTIKVDVRPKNESAQKFYQKIGLTVSALQMEKKI